MFSGVSAEADELPNGLERGGEKDRPKVLGGGVPLPLDPPVLLEGANGRENGLGRCCGGGGGGVSLLLGSLEPPEGLPLPVPLGRPKLGGRGGVPPGKLPEPELPAPPPKRPTALPGRDDDPAEAAAGCSSLLAVRLKGGGKRLRPDNPLPDGADGRWAGGCSSLLGRLKGEPVREPPKGELLLPLPNDGRGGNGVGGVGGSLARLGDPPLERPKREGDGRCGGENAGRCGGGLAASGSAGAAGSAAGGASDAAA